MIFVDAEMFGYTFNYINFWFILYGESQKRWQKKLVTVELNLNHLSYLNASLEQMVELGNLE